MSRRRLRIRLSEPYEGLLKLLLMVKQGRLSLVEAHLRLNGEGLFAELFVDGPDEKIDWFIRKACGSPFVNECRELE